MTTVLWTIAILALIGTFVAYARWFVQQAASVMPTCRVRLADDGTPGTTTAEVILVGTPRTYRLTRLTCDSASEGVAIPVIEGFSPEQEHELGDDVTSLIATPTIKVKPNQPLQLRFAYDPKATRTIRVTGWLEANVGVGGSGTFFHVLVGPLKRVERELRNLESRVRSESVTQGIKPVEHPEWSEVLRLRTSLERGTREQGHRRPHRPDNRASNEPVHAIPPRVTR